MNAKFRNLRILLCLLIVFGFFFFFGNLLVERTMNSTPLRILLTDKISEALGSQIDYQKLSISFFPFKVQMYRPKVTDIAGLKFSATNIKGRISLWSLFLGKPKIANLRIENPRIIYAQKTTRAKTKPRWLPVSNDYLESLTLIEPEIEITFLQIPQKKTSNLIIKGGKLEVVFQEQLLRAKIALEGISYLQGEREKISDASLRGLLTLKKGQFDLQIEQMSAKNLRNLQLQAHGSADVNQEGYIVNPMQIHGTTKVDGDLRLLSSLFGIHNSKGEAEGEFALQMHVPFNEAVQFLLNGTGSVKKGVLGGVRIFNTHAELSITEKEIIFTKGELQIGDEPRGSFTGKVNLRRPHAFAFTGSAAHLPLSEVLSAFHLEFPYADVDLQTDSLRVFGEGLPLSLEVVAEPLVSGISIRGLRNFKSSPTCALHLHLHTNKERMTFKNLQGNCGDKETTALAMQGTIDYTDEQKIDLQVKSERFSLTEVAFLLPVEFSGQAQTTLAITGTTGDVVVQGEMTAQNVHFAKQHIGSLLASKYEFHSKHVDWQGVHISTASGGKVQSAQGKMHYDNLWFAAQLEAKSVVVEDLRWLLAFYELPLHLGVQNLLANLQGYLWFPLAYRGTLKTTLTAVQRPDKVVLIDRLAFQARSTDSGSWRVSPLSVQALGLRLHGWLRHQRKVPLQAEKFSSSAHIWEILGMSGKDMLQLELKSSSTATTKPIPYLEDDFQALVQHLTLKLQGKVANLRGEMQANLQQVKLLGMHISNLEVWVDSLRTKLDIKMHNRNESLSGKLHLDIADKDLPYAWDFIFANYDISELAGLTFEKHVDTQVTGNWRMQGKMMYWRDSVGEITVDAFRLRYARNRSDNKFTDLYLTKKQRLRFSKKGWVAETQKMIEISGEKGSVYLTILPQNGFASLAIDFFVTLDVQLLAVFISEIDVARGFIQVEGQVRGNVDSPAVSLEVERLSPLSISVAGLQPAFNDINIKASYSNGELAIQELAGQKGDGSISVRGKLYEKSARRKNYLQVRLNNATFVHPIFGFKNTELNLSGDLTVNWHKTPVNLDGSIVINKASNFSDFDIRKVIIASFREKKYSTKGYDNKPVVNFNLAINAERSLTIENRNIQVLLSTRLQLRGDNTNPEVLGVIKIDKGKFIYRRSFVIGYGTIHFDGKRRLDPLLDIRAICDVSSYKVGLNISGYASEPVGELKVSPATRDDGTLISKVGIITLLNRGSLSSTGSRFNAGSVGVSEAANILVGQFEKPLENLLRRSGQKIINKVYIDTRSSDKGTFYPKLTAPINLPWGGWDLSLQVDPFTWKLLMEYPIHDSIILSGTVSGRSREDEGEVAEQESADDQTLDLKFRFNFK